MPSLVPGYSYDIFISYRHKDNQTVGEKEATGWVTEFVEYFKREVQSTIKEDVTIYFDENPHDGIHATHDVYDSLKGKLKCLLFIPVLSQTYCDPKSFAWQHEFLEFKDAAAKDPIGLKILLKNGNVSSRVLPVCIHDLDASDRALLEHELGPIRAIDFIFRTPGVSRPITPSDKREDNAARMLYKDQINKVALAVKDALAAIVNPASDKQSVGAAQVVPPSANHKRMKRWWVVTAIVVTALIAAFSMYKLRHARAPLIIDKSIAILPFEDMSKAHDLEYLGDGISEEIITALTAINDLRIVGRTSSFQFKGQKLDLREVGERLNVAAVLEGSVQQSGDHLRITATLIRASDNSPIWSDRYDVQQTDIFKIQDNIAGHIVEKLNLTLTSQVEGRLVKKETTPQAYTLFLKGLWQYKRENFKESLTFFEKVVSLDSLYAPGYAYLGLSKAWTIIKGRREDIAGIRDAARFSERSIELDPFLPEGYSGRALIAWAIENDFRKARTYFEKSIELNPSSSLIKNRYAYFLTWMGEFQKASQLAQEAMQSDPVDFNCYANLYNTSLYDGKFSEATSYSREWKRILDVNHAATGRDMELNFYQNSFQRVIDLCDSLVKTKNELTAKDLAYAAMASAGLRKTQVSDQLLQQLKEQKKQGRQGGYYETACVYAYRHQYDSCLANLYLSFQKREGRFSLLKIEPVFKELRSQPLFVRLYNEAGFDKY